MSPFFCNISCGQYLNAGGNSQRHLQGKITEMAKTPVFSNPDTETAVERFDVNIAGILLDGHPDEFINQAQGIQDKVRNAETSEEERETLIKEFAAAKRQLAEQRESILSDEKLMAMQEKLQADTFAAMKTSNPETEELLKELNTLLESLQ